MTGVARLVDTFLAVSGGATELASRPPSAADPLAQAQAQAQVLASKPEGALPLTPDGNTLLHIFGPWLFQGAVLPGDAAYAQPSKHTQRERKERNVHV
jgi:hypothetical protein